MKPYYQISAAKRNGNWFAEIWRLPTNICVQSYEAKTKKAAMASASKVLAIYQKVTLNDLKP